MDTGVWQDVSLHTESIIRRISTRREVDVKIIDWRLVLGDWNEGEFIELLTTQLVEDWGFCDKYNINYRWHVFYLISSDPLYSTTGSDLPIDIFPFLCFYLIPVIVLNPYVIDIYNSLFIQISTEDPKTVCSDLPTTLISDFVLDNFLLSRRLLFNTSFQLKLYGNFVVSSP